jgi:autoinducer 2-degrading protein
MHILHVYLQVKPEHIEAFRQATIENAENSRREPGVARFEVVQQAGDPTRFALLEVYRSKEGHAAHRETAHYNKWAETVTGMLAEPRTRTIYTNIYPADSEW